MFSLSADVLARLRAQSELTMHDEISLYTVTITRDLYGAETVVSGLVTTAPALIAQMAGKEDEVVERLRAEGLLKTHTAKMLVPHNTDIETNYVCVVSGINEEWDIVWTNRAITNNYQLYTKAIITRNDNVTEYKNRTRRNG